MGRTELGPLVSLAGILDRQGVQVELLLNAIEQIGAGLEQADPGDMTGAISPGASLLDGDVGDALSVRIYAAGDDARFCRGACNMLLHRIAPGDCSMPVENRPHYGEPQQDSIVYHHGHNPR